METTQVNAPYDATQWLSTLDPYLARLSEPDVSTKHAGVMLKLLFTPQFTIDTVVERTTEGRTGIRNTLADLLKMGLVTRVVNNDGKQRWNNVLWQQCSVKAAE